MDRQSPLEARTGASLLLVGSAHVSPEMIATPTKRQRNERHGAPSLRHISKQVMFTPDQRPELIDHHLHTVRVASVQEVQIEVTASILLGTDMLHSDWRVVRRISRTWPHGPAVPFSTQ